MASVELACVDFGCRLITGTPVFVASAAFRTPMSGGILAYGDRVAAERAAATHQGTIVSSLEALLARAGGEQ